MARAWRAEVTSHRSLMETLICAILKICGRTLMLPFEANPSTSASILCELAAHLSGVLIRIEASQQMDDVIREFYNRLNARRP
jgi:hypothetical protein